MQEMVAATDRPNIQIKAEDIGDQYLPQGQYIKGSEDVEALSAYHE